MVIFNEQNQLTKYASCKLTKFRAKMENAFNFRRF